ncbi:MAG: flagellar type III secretion system pore protein FliP [Alphaproteobacteria bacterium]|nr:flagellar type III secretion system pore protein FliP [Alphaproteobacteria bacterium]MBU6471026.1 flagellar type III secretion system pore protein FliP [Alphaproteobacteria bacterium]MDE2012218.1 flagellar type III secretion system pore protein FliP [Alphaproteobacteria bacterium]MDE2074863.1 flagellar type III secretion system pore protein FliP [Alphaproteobacteria bacterium]MDE2351479.1 flagellar type III secretion system pore protein FliP [Alphaproteobacteria bacterium]
MNRRWLALLVVGAVLLVPGVAFAAAPAAGAAAAGGGLNISLSGGGMFTDRVMQIVALITILSIAPSILIMMTSFVRIVVVLSLLRTAMGVQTSPPNSVIISLSLFLTLFVMTPTLTAAYNQGIAPLMAEKITTEQAFDRTTAPMKQFMLAHVREADLKLFLDMSHAKPPATPDQVALTTLAPAFMLSELKRAFEIGFLIFVPFLIIDMAVASILMSMGMMMLPPVIISLPFKLIFFVLVDGWRLIAGSLVASYMHSPPPT